MSNLGRVLAAIGSLVVVAFCLAAPVVTFIAIRPPAYPNATFVGMRVPSATVRWDGGCLRATLVNRWNFQSLDLPNDVLRWYRSERWLVNFRYDDSVIRQANSHLGVVNVNSVREIYVDRPASLTHIAAAAQYTVSGGACT